MLFNKKVKSEKKPYQFSVSPLNFLKLDMNSFLTTTNIHL